MLSFKEALKGNQHKIDKNKNGKVDAHDFHLLRKSKNAMKEDITEATVTTKKYSWGTMKTVHHGKDFSIPLHPEHHQAIAKLKDEQEHKFKDETGRHWTARRKGEDVHFHSANDGPKTQVKHSTMSEEVDLEEEGLKDACWKGYTAVGMKMKNGKKVPNCVPVKEDKDEGEEDEDEDETEDEDEKCEDCGMPEAECECEDEDEGEEDEDEKEMKEAKKKSMCEGKHVVSVTISNPNHTMVSQRNEKKMRRAKVTAPDKDTAINTALAYYKKSGYKVHDHNYVGLHNEETSTVVKDKSGKVKSWSYEGDWKKAQNKDPRGKVTNMSDKAQRKTASMKETAPVAPTLDRKYIKGTPEHKAYKATKKPINGMPTGKMKEEVDQIDELSKSTLGSYIKKAAHDATIQRKIGADFENMADKARKPSSKEASTTLANKYKANSWKRKAGVNKAVDRLTKEDVAIDEASQTWHHAGVVKHNTTGTYHSKAMNAYGNVVVHKKPFKTSAEADDFGKAINKKRTSAVHDYNTSRSTFSKEEYEMNEMRINGREYASQGVMHPDHAKMDIHKVSGQHVDFYASKTGDKMQGKVVKNDGKSVHIQAHKELGDGKLHKFKVTPHLPKPTNEEVELDEKMDMAKADMGVVIKDFKQSDAPQFAGKSAEKRRQMAIAAKLQADKAQKEERDLKKYKQFKEDIIQNLPVIEEEIDEIDESVEQLDEYETDKNGRYVHKGSYGSSYQGDDDDDDEDKPKKKPAPTGEKRGRGRPAGSTSGARQKGAATGKKRTGVDYTGYPLHLPNSNK
jgi:hypothetical protein